VVVSVARTARQPPTRGSATGTAFSPGAVGRPVHAQGPALGSWRCRGRWQRAPAHKRAASPLLPRGGAGTLMPVIRGVMSRSAEMGGVGAGSLNVSAVDSSDLRPTSIFSGTTHDRGVAAAGIPGLETHRSWPWRPLGRRFRRRARTRAGAAVSVVHGSVQGQHVESEVGLWVAPDRVRVVCTALGVVPLDEQPRPL
jgi:hypothetical protein